MVNINQAQAKGTVLQYCTLVVEDIVIFEPVQEGLPLDHGGGRVVPDVEPAGNIAPAVAVGSAAVAVAMGVARGLLLAVVGVGTVGGVDRVTLLRGAVVAAVEIDVPGGKGAAVSTARCGDGAWAARSASEVVVVDAVDRDARCV